MTDWVDRDDDPTGMVGLLWPDKGCPATIYCPDVRSKVLVALGYYDAAGIKTVQIRTRGADSSVETFSAYDLKREVLRLVRDTRDFKEWYTLSVHGHVVVEVSNDPRGAFVVLHEPYATFVGCVELAQRLGSITVPDEFLVIQSKLIISQGLVIQVEPCR